MTLRRKLAKLIRDPSAFVADSPLLRAYSAPVQPEVINLSSTIATLFDTEAHRPLKGAARDKYVYLPWIPGHGDALMELVDPDRQSIAPWALFRSPEQVGRRVRIMTFAREHPDVYRKLVLRALAPLRGELRGVILTLDWPSVMRIVAQACRELAIPSLLIPHEAVFADRDRYYVDPYTGADAPICDRVLCWGAMQRDIFVERGYPRERIAVVGSPKLDEAATFTPQLSRDLFACLYGLDPERKIVLFAMQPLDSQYDTQRARAAQSAAIADVFEACVENHAQLIVRFPPNGLNLVGSDLTARLTGHPDVAIDSGAPYLTPPAESIHHSAVVCAINSTMLLEAAIMGRQPLSMRYLEFGDLFVQAKIPSASNSQDVRSKFAAMLAGEVDVGSARAWLAENLSSGELPGLSSTRIRHELEKGVSSSGMVDALFGDRLVDGRFGSAASFDALLEPAERTEAMLGFKRVLMSPEGARVQAADVFLKSGTHLGQLRDRGDVAARELGRPQLIVDRGLSLALARAEADEAGLAIILDTKAPYYDATRSSRLEERLASDYELSESQRARARRCMERLREWSRSSDEARLSRTRPAVLLLDQPVGDPAVQRGLADGDSFLSMLEVALSERPDHDVLVRPAPRRGGNGYLAQERIRDYLPNDRIVILDEQTELRALLADVDEVFTVSSALGIHALIASVPLTTFGAPFYAGWGLTNDVLGPLPRRTRARELHEVFHFSYIEASRYYSPVLGRAAELEDVLDYLERARETAPPTRQDCAGAASAAPRQQETRVLPGQIGGQYGHRYEERAQQRA